jgi:Zn-dependent protease
MRDPLTWGLPLFRLFGVRVKVHILFLLVVIGLILRMALAEAQAIAWTDLLLFWGVLLFVIVLIHEYGHVFAVRSVGGDAREVMLWPLGGFASVDVPWNPRAHLISAAGGPLANAILCLVIALVILAAGYWPNLDPFSNPFVAELKSYRDGRIYTSQYGLRFYPSENGAMEESPLRPWERGMFHEFEMVPRVKMERAIAPTWIVWLHRAFYLSWLLLLFNLIPAYPLDGGRMLQSIVWSRSDYEQGATMAGYSGFVMGALFLILAITINESLLLALSIFMFFEAWRLMCWEPEARGAFGYDFSAGYSSLPFDEENETQPVRKSWWQRWREARQARRRKREQEQLARDEARMDELLDKIARCGKEALTEEERRFLERMSARKRNMS